MQQLLHGTQGTNLVLLPESIHLVVHTMRFWLSRGKHINYTTGVADQVHLPPCHHPRAGQCLDQRELRQGGSVLHTHSEGHGTILLRDFLSHVPWGRATCTCTTHITTHSWGCSHGQYGRGNIQLDGLLVGHV